MLRVLKRIVNIGFECQMGILEHANRPLFRALMSLSESVTDGLKKRNDSYVSLYQATHKDKEYKINLQLS